MQVSADAVAHEQIMTNVSLFNLARVYSLFQDSRSGVPRESSSRVWPRVLSREPSYAKICSKFWRLESGRDLSLS